MRKGEFQRVTKTERERVFLKSESRAMWPITESNIASLDSVCTVVALFFTYVVCYNLLSYFTANLLIEQPVTLQNADFTSSRKTRVFLPSFIQCHMEVLSNFQSSAVVKSRWDIANPALSFAHVLTYMMWQMQPTHIHIHMYCTCTVYAYSRTHVHKERHAHVLTGMISYAHRPLRTRLYELQNERQKERKRENKTQRERERQFESESKGKRGKETKKGKQKIKCRLWKRGKREKEREM